MKQPAWYGQRWQVVSQITISVEIMEEEICTAIILTATSVQTMTWNAAQSQNAVNLLFIMNHNIFWLLIRLKCITFNFFLSITHSKIIFCIYTSDKKEIKYVFSTFITTHVTYQYLSFSFNFNTSTFNQKLHFSLEFIWPVVLIIN